MKAKTVRFWVYLNSPVLIKMSAGQTLHHSHGGATDEGYSWQANRWHFDGAYVHSETTTEARDCDGRYSGQNDAFFPVADVRAGYIDPDDKRIVYPKWEHGGSFQRDHSAEAMGY